MSGHFYDNLGNPRHFVKGKNGKNRPSTLTDAKKNNWVPGATTILNLLAKPALDFWIKGQILDAVIRAEWKPRLSSPEEKIKQWKGAILEESTKVGMEAANRGSEIHKSLELYFKEGIIDEKERDYIEPVINYIKDSYREFEWQSEVTFCHEGYGGCVDLIGYQDGHPKYIIDFKTKKDKAFDFTMKTDDKLMQLASYKLAFDKKSNGKFINCSNLFISVETPGKFLEVGYTKEELDRGAKMFLLLKDYWHLAHNTKGDRHE